MFISTSPPSVIFYYLLIIFYVLPSPNECVSAEKLTTKISLTVSAKYRNVEISWFNLKPFEGIILLTDFEPSGNDEFHKLYLYENLPIPSFQRALDDDDDDDNNNNKSDQQDDFDHVIINDDDNDYKYMNSNRNSKFASSSPPSILKSDNYTTYNNNNNGFVINDTILETTLTADESFNQRRSAVTESSISSISSSTERMEKIVWTYGLENKTVLYTIIPDETFGWHTTNIEFLTSLLLNINITTKCYGYWATYVSLINRTTSSRDDDNYNPSSNNNNNNGGYSNILLKTCLSAYPTWMNDMKSHIEQFKIRDLFLVGSHDSGSYRNNFNPLHNETLVSKYTLTQDDDVRSQLMHGIRYLDIRIGFYRAHNPQFWINHGISRQQPLIDIIQQVKEFVRLTNEIVIFDIQEFPVGFGKQHDIHHLLVQYLYNELNEFIADPDLTWDCTLNDIWKRKKLIILSYDYVPIVYQFPTILWQSVMQRWANTQNVMDLKRYLSPIGRNFMIISKRPIADMAELTPTAWDVLTDRYHGLRHMADHTNNKVSLWYFDEWGPSANIVAVDFYRGTNLIETSIYWNKKRDILHILLHANHSDSYYNNK